jgi:hypothetical protein
MEPRRGPILLATPSTIDVGMVALAKVGISELLVSTAAGAEAGAPPAFLSTLRT